MRFRALVFWLVISLYPAIAFSQNTCHAANDTSARIITLINNLMDPSLSAGRASLGIPTVAPANVVLVTDTAACARAGQAVDSVLHVWNPTTQIPTPPNPLYVIQVGTAYAVADYDSPNPTNLSRWLLVFGSAWQYLAAFRL